MQMACEYNPSFYLCGDSRFDPPRLRPTSLMNRFIASNSQKSWRTPVALSLSPATTLTFRPIRLEGERTFTREYRNGRSLNVE